MLQPYIESAHSLIKNSMTIKQCLFCSLRSLALTYTRQNINNHAYPHARQPHPHLADLPLRRPAGHMPGCKQLACTSSWPLPESLWAPAEWEKTAVMTTKQSNNTR